MSRPTKITINSDALLHNLQRVRDYSNNTKIIAMVKANAYGHGIDLIAPMIANQVDALGVACIEEALQIRELEINTPIILMEGYFSSQELSEIEKYNLDIVLHDYSQLSLLSDYTFSQAIKIWIKVNTGMNRLGFAVSKVDDVVTKLKSIDINYDQLGFMTHFAESSECDSTATNVQYDAFENCIVTFDGSVKSLANSAAIINDPHTHADYVRPGIMLYGISPFEYKNGCDYNLQAVMSLTSKIIAINICKVGDKVGYGGSWSCAKDSLIGIVAVGYGDGYPRCVSSDAYVLVNGKKVPIVGRISMDMLSIDLTEHPETVVGDEVLLWGDALPIEEVARFSGTIPYELVCNVTNRVRMLSKDH